VSERESDRGERDTYRDHQTGECAQLENVTFVRICIRNRTWGNPTSWVLCMGKP